MIFHHYRYGRNDQLFNYLKKEKFNIVKTHLFKKLSDSPKYFSVFERDFHLDWYYHFRINLVQPLYWSTIHKKPYIFSISQSSSSSSSLVFPHISHVAHAISMFPLWSSSMSTSSTSSSSSDSNTISSSSYPSSSLCANSFNSSILINNNNYPQQHLHQHQKKDDNICNENGNGNNGTNCKSQTKFLSLNEPSLLNIFAFYKDLSKVKLSSLVLMTTLTGYILSPKIAYSSLFSLPSLSILLPTLLGTALCSFSANAFNQWMEAPFDAQMNRTRERVLPTHSLSPPHAFGFAFISGLLGLSILYTFINPLTTILALCTIILYAGVYTPAKRMSIANTWIGSIVGAIPPCIGWAAASSFSYSPSRSSSLPSMAPLDIDFSNIQSSPLGTETILSTILSYSSSLSSSASSSMSSFLGLESGAWLLAGVLFAWQFPHFNSLSYSLGKDYSKAGYRMCAVLNPSLNARVALRYSLALIPITFGAVYTQLTDPFFILTGNIINIGLVFHAWKFYQNQSPKTARKLFFASLIHLPLFLMLLFIHKKSCSNKITNND